MTRFFLSCLTVKSVFAPLLFLLTAGLSQLSAQNCDPLNDTIPPVAVCSETVYVSLGGDDPNDCYESNGTTQWGGVLAGVTSFTFNQGSFDNCGGSLKITLQRQQPYSACISGLNPVNGLPPCGDANPDTPSEYERATGEAEFIKFYGCEAGTSQTIIMRVYQLDADGNVAFHQGQPLMTQCFVTVIVEDKVPPTCTATDVTVSCEDYDPTLAAYGNPVVMENVCLDTIIKTANTSQLNTACLQGSVTRTFRVVDCSGNSSTCSQKITVVYEQDYYVRFPDDVIVTVQGGNYGEPTFFGEDCEALAVSYSDLVFTTVPDADLLIERTWEIINWCTYNPALPTIEVPNPNPNPVPNHPMNLIGPVVSAADAPMPWNPSIVYINPDDPAPTNYSVFYNANANAYRYTQSIKVIESPQAIVTGKVYLDTLSNCIFDTGEPLLSGWTVKLTGLVTGETYQTFTDNNGIYAQSLPGADTLTEVTLAAPFNWAQNCPSVYTVAAASGQVIEQDIAAHLETTCPLLSIDLATPRLRRCFPNTYAVQTCNLGAETVENVSAEITLDPFMTFTNSSIPGTPLGNNTWSFEVGNLAAGACASFNINFTLECSAIAGATHCTEAHIYPDTICNPPAQWSGADIEIAGFCDVDSVRMTISNIGTGDMAQPLEFVVVEDVIMFQSGSFQLESGEIRTIALPANGATWRLEADEEIDHPWGGVEAKAVEGCGGLNTPGLVTQFSLNTPDPFETTDCRQNVGSFDPNDKQAFPRGYGNQHLLEADTDIEYLIRFQNTGTDTAFTVVVLDTLSAYLDARNVRPGVSSHRYDFALLDDNVLRFRFDNILLPDSNANEPASHGFIKFRVPQQPGNPDGSVIENSAAIYFDFNDPIITNTAFHTIGDHFILVKTDDPAGLAPLTVYPNPAASVAIFELPAPADRAVFELSDRLGQSLRADVFSGKQYRFERGILPAGMYFYAIRMENKVQYTGKMLLK